MKRTILIDAERDGDLVLLSIGDKAGTACAMAVSLCLSRALWEGLRDTVARAWVVEGTQSTIIESKVGE